MIQPYISKEDLGEFSGVVKHRENILEFIRKKLPDFDSAAPVLVEVAG